VTREEIGLLALALPATTHVVQWGDSDVYKVGGKVFAVCGLSGGLSFKVTPIGFEVLTQGGGPGRQAPYFAKGHWVNMPLEDLDPTDAADWMMNAHGLMAAKLTRKARAELGLG
jgi:predicted DNA-binding protein (MmcQ/YjbR family)